MSAPDEDGIGPDGETLGIPDPAHGTLDESVPVVTEAGRLTCECGGVGSGCRCENEATP